VHRSGERRAPRRDPVAAPMNRRLQMTAAQRIARFAIRSYARWRVWRACSVTVSGLDQLPARGPVVLAARHVHHLFDATVLLTALPRPLHFLVALDWAHSRCERWLLERACRLAVWPGLLRADRLPPDSSVWQPAESRRYGRRSLQESVAILVAGRTLVVFPEGSPAIDPERPARDPSSLLAFQPGFASIARQAARCLGQPVPVIPVGLAYQSDGRRWHVQARLGSPMLIGQQSDRDAVTRTVEAEVRRLSSW
jgi:1-acyl-sn-glycerol-3-phosphate acyltransferase